VLIFAPNYGQRPTPLTEPRLDVLKKIALTMNVTIDSLVFGEGERNPTDDLRLQFEAVSKMPDEEKKIVKALLEGMIVKYQTKQMVGGLSS
jgi:predicted enzyme involved in methoxymalonyl-ACP biosynthesis